jgi:hypothetical protein
MTCGSRVNLFHPSGSAEDWRELAMTLEAFEAQSTQWLLGVAQTIRALLVDGFETPTKGRNQALLN